MWHKKVPTFGKTKMYLCIRDDITADCMSERLGENAWEEWRVYRKLGMELKCNSEDGSIWI